MFTSPTKKKERKDETRSTNKLNPDIIRAQSSIWRKLSSLFLLEYRKCVSPVMLIPPIFYKSNTHLTNRNSKRQTNYSTPYYIEQKNKNT